MNNVHCDVIQQLWVWGEELHQTLKKVKNNLFLAYIGMEIPPSTTQHIQPIDIRGSAGGIQSKATKP
jgi:hypothetical protein